MSASDTCVSDQSAVEQNNILYFDFQSLYIKYMVTVLQYKLYLGEGKKML
jgi:hypothetical protein